MMKQTHEWEASAIEIDPATGLPVIRFGRIITADDLFPDDDNEGAVDETTKTATTTHPASG